jgi:hypothetical protein
MTKLKARMASETGSVLITSMIAASLLAAIGLSLAGLGNVELAIGANHRAGSQTLYAAEAAAEGVVAELLAVSSWTDVLSGAASSRFTGSQTPPVGPGEPAVTLAQLTTALQAESDASGSWGANSPRWRLFSFGRLDELAPAAAPDGDDYLAAWVADDVGETDGDPFTDTNGRLQITARATNHRGMRRTIALMVGQTSGRTASGFPGARILAWREGR